MNHHTGDGGEGDPDDASRLAVLSSGLARFKKLDFPIVAGGQVALAWYEKDSSSPLYANELSTGTLRFLHLASLLLSPKLPPLVLLDEPELAARPHGWQAVSRSSSSPKATPNARAAGTSSASWALGTLKEWLPADSRMAEEGATPEERGAEAETEPEEDEEADDGDPRLEDAPPEAGRPIRPQYHGIRASATVSGLLKKNYLREDAATGR